MQTNENLIYKSLIGSYFIIFQKQLPITFHAGLQKLWCIVSFLIIGQEILRVNFKPLSFRKIFHMIGWKIPCIFIHI